MIKTDTVIIGAGPVGLFAIHQLGIKGLKCVVIDNLIKLVANVLNFTQINQFMIYQHYQSVVENL